MTIETVIAAAAIVVFAATMAYAGFTDVLTMRIANRLVLFMAAAWLFFSLASGAGPRPVLLGLAAGCVVLVLAGTLFAMGWIGGGDAKLASVAALWCGPERAGDLLLWTSVAGGVLTGLVVAFRACDLPAWAARKDWLLRLHSPGVGVPYGVALAIGGIAALPGTRWMTAALA